MSWQCNRCNHFIADGLVHSCINDELELANHLIETLRAELKARADWQQKLSDRLDEIRQDLTVIQSFAFENREAALECQQERIASGMDWLHKRTQLALSRISEAHATKNEIGDISE